MNTLKNCVFITEIQKDITIDGILQKYDDSSPIMIGKVVGGNNSVISELRKDIPYGPLYITCFRGNKTAYFGTYLINYENIIEVMNEKEFEDL